MSNTKYQLEGVMQKNINAKLLYVTSSRYEGDWPSIRHSHYFTELFYVKNGRGSFLVEDQSFPLNKDDIVILNPNVEHTEVSKKDWPLEYIILGVEGLGFTFENNQEYTVFNCENKKEHLLFYFSALLNETETKGYDYEIVCQDLLEVLLIHLIRLTDSAFEIISSQKSSSQCARIKRYIDSNYKDEISLDELADMAHLNKYYFVHSFTKFYGLSPMSYLTEKRILVSKDLLQNTNHNIAEVAQLTGFSSQSYFAQCFKKSCGMPAGTYRKLVRKS